MIYSRQASAERLSEITSNLVYEKNDHLLEVSYDQFSSIEFSDVSFDYGREQVLSGINMLIEKL